MLSKIIKKKQPFKKEMKIVKEYVEKYEGSILRDMYESLNREDDDLMHKSIALGVLSFKDILGINIYDKQIQGALSISLGTASEIKTGQGKTYIAALSAMYLYKKFDSVHIASSNDYLAERDVKELYGVYSELGITASFIKDTFNIDERIEAYKSMIIYSTVQEFGFDFVKNGMQFSRLNQTIGGLKSLIIDEMDSVILDEALSPLVVAGYSDFDEEFYNKIYKIALGMSEDIHYELSLDNKRSHLKEDGYVLVEDAFKVFLDGKSIYDEGNSYIVNRFESALSAIYLYEKDQDYLVEEDSIKIIDEHTGRKADDSRWKEGLQQFMEIKESVKVMPETSAQGKISYHSFITSYGFYTGMSGTLISDADEIASQYGLNTITIDEEQETSRIDLEDELFLNDEYRDKALIERIKNAVELGRPVLLGTQFVEQTERLSKLLEDNNLNHDVLNAKNHKREFEIISNAGKPSSITISTNMAGRGTDIILGGDKALSEFQDNREIALKAGGLLVIGYGRNNSIRLDQQLMGRSGRQGEPGESIFMLSPSDLLLEGLNEGAISKLISIKSGEDFEPISSSSNTKVILKIQEKLSLKIKEVRKNFYDREKIYAIQYMYFLNFRDEILDNEEGYVLIKELNDEIEVLVKDFYEEYDKGFRSVMSAKDRFNMINELVDDTRLYLGISLDPKDLMPLESADLIIKGVMKALDGIVEGIISKIGINEFTKIMFGIKLSTLDKSWHFFLMDIENISKTSNFHSYANQDPTKVYQKASFMAFDSMLGRYRMDYITNISRIRVAEVTPE